MEIIAERTLEIELRGEVDKKAIRVLIGKPEAAEDDSWQTPYEIHGPGSDEVLKRVAHGVDALQALALALYVLPATLASYERRGRLIDHGQVGFSLGLPVDQAIARDE